MKLAVRITASAIVLMLIVAMLGCSDWERKTFQSLSVSQAVINESQADYESGKLPHNQKSYDAINAAKALQTTAVQAMASYEGLKANGATPSALQAQQQIVLVALSNLESLIAVVKALYVHTSAQACWSDGGDDEICPDDDADTGELLTARCVVPATYSVAVWRTA